MRIMKNLKKLVVGVCASALAVMIAAPGIGAFAASDNAGASDTSSSGSGVIDTSRNGTLTVEYIFKDAGEGEAYPTPGVVTHIYKIADVDEKGNFNLLSPYNKAINPDTLKNVFSIAEQSQWDEIIKTLTQYIKANNVPDFATVTADQNGEAAVGEVGLGLYMGLSDPLKFEGRLYQYYPFLSMVPTLPVNEDGTTQTGFTWDDISYDVVVAPKREVSKLDDPTEYKVYKQWSGDDPKTRPSSVTVKIFCDGAEFKTVELSSMNNWQYSWVYEKGHFFNVEEILSDTSYTPTITQNETSFIIVNTKTPETPGNPKRTDNPPDNPDSPDSPDDSTVVDNPGTESEAPSSLPEVLGAVRDFIGDLPAVLGARRLPQTGQLWWPIPVLAILGIVLVGLGIRSEKKRKTEK